MSIYLQLPKIQGNVSDKNHQHWIKLEFANVGGQRHVGMPVGESSGRIHSRVGFSEMQCHKELDQATALIFQHYCSGKVMPKVIMEMTDSQGTYLKYELHDVLISSHHVGMDNQQYPVEHFNLNYRTMEMTITPRDASHKAGAPVRAGFDLEKAVVM